MRLFLLPTSTVNLIASAAPFGPQVVHPGLQALLPGIKMHGGELGEGGIFHKEIERLRLADVGRAIGSHIDERLLLDLPDCFVELFERFGNLLNVLDRSILGQRSCVS